MRNPNPTGVHVKPRWLMREADSVLMVAQNVRLWRDTQSQSQVTQGSRSRGELRGGGATSCHRPPAWPRVRGKLDLPYQDKRMCGVRKVIDSLAIRKAPGMDEFAGDARKNLFCLLPRVVNFGNSVLKTGARPRHMLEIGMNPLDEPIA